MRQPLPAERDETLVHNGHLPDGRDPAGVVAAPAPPDQDAPGPGSLADRVLRPRTLVSFGIAFALLLFFLRRLDIEPAAIWRQVRGANPWLYALAFVVWYGSFFLRAGRWRRMLARVGIDAAHGYRVPGTTGMVEIFLLSWFANCVVPAKLGDAYRSYLLKQESKASFSTALGTILAERLTDLIVLFLTMSAIGVALFRGRLPAEATQTFLLGSILLGLAAVGLAAMWWSRHALQRRLPARVQEQYGRLHDAVFCCLRRPGPFLALSAVIWFSEGLRFWLVARSLHADLSPATALFIALMGSLLTTLPITPAGLGVVELGTGAVLVKVIGLDPALAGSIVLLDRVVAYWSLILVGLALYVRRLRRGSARSTHAGVRRDDPQPAPDVYPAGTAPPPGWRSDDAVRR